MVDYYEELSLVKGSDIEHIQEELVRLESLWHKREVNSPEKANKMLGLIMDARKIFASEISRKKYDNDLEVSRREPEDPDVLRSKSLEKWINQARAFYNDRQYDLAKVAIEKAIYLSNVNGDDDVLFALAADIYKDNGDLDIAMTYINRAIVAASDISAYYLSKGIIYDLQASVTLQRGNYGNASNIRTEARKMFQLADMKAKENDDLANRAHACGVLAFSFYFQDPMDKEEGENFANLAVKFGGDSWGNADKVLKEVNAIREEIQRKERERENARKDGIYSEAKKMAGSQEISELERAISKFELISDYKDAVQQIEDLVIRIQKIVDDTEKEKQSKTKKRKREIKIILVTIPIVAAMIVIGMFVSNIQYQKCGENLKWSYDTDTKVLTITGTGSMYDDYEPYSASLGSDHNRKRPWDSDSLYNEIEIIIIEDGCTRIGEYAFSSFVKLTSIEIPNSVTSIGDSAFSWCENLEVVDLPDNLVSIDGDPFWASGLKSIYLPETVESLGSIADGAGNLEEIIVDANNSNFTSLDGVLFNDGMTVLWSYPSAKKGDSYSIPESVTEISSVAFRFAENLKSVYIPETVTTIGWHAFEDCSNLVEVNIPLAVTVLPEEIFGGCGFVSVSVPAHIVEIESFAYSQCWNLETVYIPDGVEKIGSYAFSSCYYLRDITIPQSITSIEITAFDDCKEDAIIHYLGTKEQWLSFASDMDFAGVVECSDGDYRYN